MDYARFALVLLAVGLLTAAAAAALMAWALVRPPRMTDAKALWTLRRLTPMDLGLRYEEVSFDVRDHASGRPLRLAGWWIGHPSADGRCVILLHGYADAKVGAIAWAPMLHDLQWNVLALDLRAHGESEGSFITAGSLERHDVAQVVDQLREMRPADTRHLALMGLSLGATVAAATAALRNDFAAVILDSPVADERTAIMAQFDLMGLPGRWIQRLAIRFARWMTGTDVCCIRPVDLLDRIECPLMVITCENDPYVTPDEAAAIEAAMRQRSDRNLSAAYWRLPNAGHLLALSAAPALYRQRLAEFLEE